MATNRLIIVACGGCATNVTDKALKNLKDLGEGFADVEYHFIDTSRNNYDNIEPIGSFYQVKRMVSNDKNVINGSGGERALTAKESLANVPMFLDSIKLSQKQTNVFVCVTYSASGGWTLAA